MLHILWLILKFILIILGILLGLLLLAVLLILFCPIRYKASAVKTEGSLKQIEGEGVVSWLFHGISLRAEWKDQNLDLAFHLFGIPVDKLLKKRQERKIKAQKTKEKKPETFIAEKTETAGKPEVINKTQTEPEEKKTESGQFEENSRKNIVASDISEPQEQYLDEQRTAETVSAEKFDETSEKTAEQAERKTFFIKKIYNRLQNIFKTIQTKVRSIKKTFHRMRKQVFWWKAFLGHPRVKAARDLVWKHAKFLLKHIFPTRIEGQLTFSFEDPALTGTALALLGMTIPFHKNCVQINPRFDGENYLQGNIKAKGRIYGFVFVRAALSIYFDKNIKYVIKRWKTRRA